MPLGIFSGIIAIMIVLKIVNYILADFLNNFEFIYSITPLAIVISILITALTIFLSCVSSARKASKVTPIELIRSSNDIKIKSKKLKCPKIITKLFNVGGEIAYKNLKRSKKKYRVTIVSLVVSIVTFIAISSFIDYGFNMSNVYYKELNYNFILYSSNKDINKDYDLYSKIASSSSVSKYSIHRSTTLKIDYNKYLTEFGRKVNIDEDTSKENKLYITVISVGEEEYKRYLKSIGEKYENCKDKAILIDSYLYYGEKKEEGEIYNLKVGDVIEGDIGESRIDLKIATRTNKKPMGLEESNNSLGFLIISDELMDRICKDATGEMYISSDNTEKLVEEIEEYKKQESFSENDIAFSNYDEYVKSNNALVLVISIFLYGFIAVITAIRGNQYI